jgi:pyridinium-3,5-bisthiocarboxylic acid mononucleotide nickel chelatase
MAVLYLDIFSGASGDMFVGALLDLGVDPGELRHALRELPLQGWKLTVERRQKSGIEGVKFDARPESKAVAMGTPSRDFSAIRRLIDATSLSPKVKSFSIATFSRVAAAEGKVHGLPPDKVHFHEVGAVDSIVDIIGAAFCLERLGWPRVEAAPVVEGRGWVDCAHGRFPVPTAATLEILGARGVALTQCEEPFEMVTPTGAALLAEAVVRFGPMQGLVARRIGYGLGTRDFKSRPNVLRAVLGDSEATLNGMDWESDTVAVLETNLDDVTGEVLGSLVESTLALGALDVFHTPVAMKKNRPGVLLTVLCAADQADRFTERLLRHTTAFGVRRSFLERRKLAREFLGVPTPFGEIRVKIGRLNGEVVQVAPEFDVCRDRALQAGAPVREVMEAAAAAARSLLKASAG